MRRLSGLGVALALALALAGCAQKTEQANETASDSLLAANPAEPPQTGITPQTEYQPEPPKQETPPPPKPVASKPKPKPAPPAEEAPRAQPAPRGVTVPAGTAIKINVAAQITSETAQAGDTWTGVVTEPLIIGTSAPIPAGSKVSGVVAAA